MLLAIRKLGIQILNHAEHHAGDVFLGVLVRSHLALDVAEGATTLALQAEGRDEDVHQRTIRLGREDLQILRRGLSFALAVWRLGEQSQRNHAGCCGNGEESAHGDIIHTGAALSRG